MHTSHTRNNKLEIQDEPLHVANRFEYGFSIVRPTTPYKLTLALPTSFAPTDVHNGTIRCISTPTALGEKGVEISCTLSPPTVSGSRVYVQVTPSFDPPPHSPDLPQVLSFRVIDPHTGKEHVARTSPILLWQDGNRQHNMQLLCGAIRVVFRKQKTVSILRSQLAHIDLIALLSTDTLRHM